MVCSSKWEAGLSKELPEKSQLRSCCGFQLAARVEDVIVSPCAVLVGPQLEALASVRVKRLVVVLALRDPRGHPEALFDQILADVSKHPALQNRLSGDLGRQSLRIRQTLNQVQRLWQLFFAIVSGRSPLRTQLDVGVRLTVPQILV